MVKERLDSKHMYGSKTNSMKVVIHEIGDWGERRIDLLGEQNRTRIFRKRLLKVINTVNTNLECYVFLRLVFSVLVILNDYVWSLESYSSQRIELVEQNVSHYKIFKNCRQIPLK